MEKENDGWVITKINKYYDPEYDIEYCDIEVNGEKPDPEEDTQELDSESNNQAVNIYDLRWCHVK